jgi:hypothetical protein
MDVFVAFVQVVVVPVVLIAGAITLLAKITRQ